MWRADWLSGSGDVDELVDAWPVCLKSWVWSPAWHKQGLVACICNPSIGDWVQKDQKFKVMLGRTEWDHLEVHEILFKGRKGRVMYKETHWCCKPCLTNEDSNDKRVCECVDVGRLEDNPTVVPRELSLLFSETGSFTYQAGKSGWPADLKDRFVSSVGWQADATILDYFLKSGSGDSTQVLMCSKHFSSFLPFCFSVWDISSDLLFKVFE